MTTLKESAIAYRAANQRHNINPWIYNSRQNISLAIKARQGWRFNELLGCTVDDFRWHLERQFRDGMSFANYGEWGVDHTLQCFAFPVDDPSAKFKCHHWSNLSPAWLNEIKSRSTTERPVEIPDYETLKHFTPRATIINANGIPELVQCFDVDSVDIVDKAFSKTKSAKYASTYKGRAPGALAD